MNAVTIIQDIESSLHLLIEENAINYNELNKSSKYLIHLIDSIKDYRDKSLITYKLSDLVLSSLILIMKQEFKSFVYASTYMKLSLKEFQEIGLFMDGRTPSHDTLRRMFILLDAQELKAKIIDSIDNFFKKILQSSNEKDKKELVSIDGKEFKGSGRNKHSKNPKGNINVLNYYSATKNLCKQCVPLTDKQSEIMAAQKLLKTFNLKNTIVTADSLHCQINTCQIIADKKGDYVITVKSNQQELLEEMKIKMTKEAKKVSSLTLNKCDYYFLLLSKTYAGCEFPKQRAYVKMVSHKRDKQALDKTTERYFITSLSNPQTIAESIDNRWKIENDLHKLKDDFYEEDDYTFTDKNAVKVMATFNNIAFSFFKIASSIIPNSTPTITRILFKKDPINIIELISPLLEGKQINKLIKDNLKGRK